ADQQGDRRSALLEREDGAELRLQHPLQAEPFEPGGSGRLRRPAPPLGRAGSLPVSPWAEPVLLRIGPVAIRWYGLLLALAILLATGALAALLRRQGHPRAWDEAVSLALAVGPLGLVGARLAFILQNFPLFLGDAGRMVAIWEGGLALHGALVGGLLALAWRERRSGRFLRRADELLTVLPLAQAVGRWGNLFNRELLGRPPQHPWGYAVQAAGRPPSGGGAWPSPGPWLGGSWPSPGGSGAAGASCAGPTSSSPSSPWPRRWAGGATSSTGSSWAVPPSSPGGSSSNRPTGPPPSPPAPPSIPSSCTSPSPAWPSSPSSGGGPWPPGQKGPRAGRACRWPGTCWATGRSGSWWSASGSASLWPGGSPWP